MITRLLTAVLALGALLALPEVVRANTDPGNLTIMQRNVAIQIAPDGTLYVRDRETPLNRLATQLRRAGYEPHHTIHVSIPDETPRRVLVAVSRELASRGYRRILFVKPPRATAEAVDETP